MADVWNLQSNLNRGELHPSVSGRVDLGLYYNGLEEATNVICLPLGGVRKRPGTKHITELPATENAVRIEPFLFSVDDGYLFYFTDRALYVYRSDGTLVPFGTQPFITIPHTAAQIAEMDFFQALDTAIVLHEDVAPMRIARFGPRGSEFFALTSILITSPPQFFFNDEQSPAGRAALQRLTFNNISVGDRFQLAVDGILTEDIVFGGGFDLALNRALIALPNVSGVLVTVTTDGASQAVATIALPAQVYPPIVGFGVNTGSANFRVDTVILTQGRPRTEPVWSATRGWPRTGTFHEGRLWFGGSKSLVNSVWGSRIGDFFNFLNQRNFDDESIFVTLDTDQVNQIQSIISNRGLQIFTTGSEFTVRGSPLTPSNVAAVPQSTLGSRRIRPIRVEGVTLYVQSLGRSVRQFVFVDEFQASQSTTISLLSSHLLDDVVDISAKRSSTTDDTQLVYLLTRAGDVIVHTTLQEEQVTGFTRCTYPGPVRTMCVLDNQPYYVIEVGNRLYLATDDPEHHVDLARTRHPLMRGLEPLTGLGDLRGQDLAIIGDGISLGMQVVRSDKIVPEHAVTDLTVGFPYKPIVRTMPLNVQLQNGPNATARKKIARCAVRTINTIGMTVNGLRYPDRFLGDDWRLPTPLNEVVRLHILGWDLTAQVTLSQDGPYPWELAYIALEIKT